MPNSARSFSFGGTTPRHCDTMTEADRTVVLTELQDLLCRDRPIDIFAYIETFAKQRANILHRTPVEQATILCDAAATSNTEYLQSLLGQGIDPNVSDYDKRHPLHLAAEEGHLECVKLLVEAGAAVGCEDRWGTKPLDGAIQNHHLEVAEYLKSQGAQSSVNQNEHGATALCNAAGKGDVVQLRALLAKGISPNAADYDKRTALHLAAEEGHLECVKELVEAGGDVNAQDRWLTSPLTGAENCNNTEVAHFLRSNGAKSSMELSVNTCMTRHPSFMYNTRSSQDLINAAGNNNIEEINRLVAAGLDPNAGDINNRTALQIAAEEGNYDAVKCLVEHGASVMAKDRWGTSALQCAIRNTHNDVASFLKDHGARTEKFAEMPSYTAYQRRTRNFFDAMASCIGFPTTDVLPLNVLMRKLKYEYGMNLDDHLMLLKEVRALARSKADSMVGMLLTEDTRRALEEYQAYADTHQPDLAECVMTWPDFADSVLHPLPEHERMSERDFSASHDNVLSTVVLDKLVIKNWEAFTSNIRAIYEDVLYNTPNDGECAQYIPELRSANPNRFGVSVCTVDGQRCHLGDTEDTFSVQSVGKTFAYTLALRDHGADVVHEYVGREPSGRAFNDFTLTRKGHPFNPVTNAGAIVTCSLLNNNIEDTDERLRPYKAFVAECAGGMDVGDCLDVYRSEQGCAFRNYALANFMRAENTFPPEIDSHEKLSKTVEFYLRVCSCRVSTPLLANCAATYANYGRNPLTGKALITETEVKQTLQILASCGMYDYSGEWACTIGMPAKSGVSGEIFIIVPGVLGLCVWSPKLDCIGNSVRGIRFAKAFADKFRFSVLDLLFRAKETA